MDESSTTFRYNLAKEIFEVLKRIFDARNQRRARIFARELAPMMEKMRANHSDFLGILSSLIDLNDRIIFLLETNKNDTKNEIDAIISELKKLHDIRIERRISRREMFEEAVWQSGRLEQGQEFRSLSLSQDEAKTMSLFYTLISRYFHSDERVYGHDISHLIEHVFHSAYFLKRKTLHGERDLQEMKDHKNRILLYEKRLEESWGEISRSFAGLKRLE